MCIRMDLPGDRGSLALGSPIYLAAESEAITNCLPTISILADPLKSCSLYSQQLKGQVVTVAKFTQGIEYDDFTGNPFILKELLCLGIRHIAYFGEGRERVINALGCNDQTALEHLIAEAVHDPFEGSGFVESGAVYHVGIQNVQTLLNNWLERYHWAAQL